MFKLPTIKTLISAFMMLTISTASFGSAYAASKTYNFSTSDSTVIFEAEDMVLGKDASIISGSTASGGKSVKVTATTKNDSADNIKNPTMYADINIDKAGKYSLYARVKCPGVNNNEVFYKHTNNTSYSTFTFDYGTNYTWVKIFDVTTVSGIFSISFKYKEINLEFDKFVFTSKEGFSPTGAYDVPTGEKKLIYNSPEIKPIEGHPRLFATKDDIETIKANTQSEELKTLYATLKSYADSKKSYYVLSDTISSGCNFSGHVTNRLQARAFMSLIGEATSEYNRQTIDWMKSVYATVKWDPSFQDITRTMGELILTGALVYDWCYDDMTSADKEFFIAHFKKVSYTKEIGYPPTKTYAFAGHGGERELFCDLLSAGVACYDEDPEIWELAAGRFFDEYQKSRIEFNETGSHPVGSSYGQVRYMWELCAATIFDSMGYENIMGEDIGKVVYRYIYHRLPNGLWIKDNDDYTYSSNSATGFNYSMNYGNFYNLAAHLSRDEYVRGEWLKLFSINSYSYITHYMWTMIFSHPEDEIKSLEELPLTYASSYPLTGVTARTGWQAGLDSDTSVIYMKAEEKNTTDTSFADLGNFMIYYKGNLAINGGSYSYANTGGGWGGSHARNYAKRTISKNCMTVYDPNEVFNTFYGQKQNTPLANDGGQFTFTPLVKTSDEYFQTPDLARTDGLYVGPNENTPVFSYVKTDLTNAYSDKITKYSRSMVAINFFDEDIPQGFICFDNMETKAANLKKKWLLQSINEPVVTGNETVIKRTEKGYNGKLTVNTLLPASDNYVIEKVGGEGYDSWVDGKNYPNPDPSGVDSEQGGWRIELSTKTDATHDVFLNAMYVSDADSEVSITPIYEETDSFYGVTMKNNSVYFSKEYNTDKSDSFTITVRDNGYETVNVLVTDVANGKWNVSGTNIVTEVSGNENALCVSIAPGTYTFSKTDLEVSEQTFEEVSRNEIGDFNIYNVKTKLFVYHEDETKLIDGVPYVPVRCVFERLGATVTWADGKVTIASSKTAVITPGSKTYTLNGKSSTLKYSPINIDSVTYVYPKDFDGVLGVTFSYDSLAKILKVS